MNKKLTFQEFLDNKPILYGYIIRFGKIKYGSFKLVLNKVTGEYEYQYYTPNGRKGKGSFSVVNAFSLYDHNKLSTEDKKIPITEYYKKF